MTTYDELAQLIDQMEPNELAEMMDDFVRYETNDMFPEYGNLSTLEYILYIATNVGRTGVGGVEDFLETFFPQDEADALLAYLNKTMAGEEAA